ncbi:YCF48-related protein [Pseudomonas fluorescens]|nr:YCF48-related protein [Pseudomonas fluorescens]
MCAMRTAFASSGITSTGLKLASGAMLALALSLSALSVTAKSFVDPLDQPASTVLQAAQKPLRDIVNTGKRLIAVGDNGLIIFSDNQAGTWRQAQVPVSVDFNAVHFADEQHGWAVGHGAVILHSSDGGETWTKQLDGRQLEALVVDYFKNKSGLEPAQAESYLSAILSMSRPGPGQFFMGVWFDESGSNGFAVGPFGLIVGSHDGGKTWQPWNTRIDNNDLLHLTAIGEVGGRLFITGERGHVWSLDPGTGRFSALQTGYEGTLFGITGAQGALLAYGLRGHVFRSADEGHTWSPVKSDLTTGVVAGAALSGRGVVLVSQSAQVAMSRDQGGTFTPLDIQRPSLFSGVVGVSDHQLALVGLNGVTTMNLK